MDLKNKHIQKALWIFKRLSVISFHELLFRLKERIDILLMYIQFKLNLTSEIKVYQFTESQYQLLPDFKWKSISDANKKKLLDEEIPIFGCEWFWKKSNLSRFWHIAPENNNLWPDYFFDKISFRQGNPIGDIRIAWEASRLQHLIALALIVKSSSNTHEKNEAIRIYCEDILSWHKQNPNFTGIHYVSSMECALRIISLSISFDLIRNQLGHNKKDVSQAVSSIITDHASFIIKRMSLHSSAGNHVLAESTGLILAGLLFSEHPSSKSWLTFGLEVFDNEIDRQINNSGFGIEGASTYLIQIIEYGILCDSFLRKFHFNVPSKTLKAIARGLQQVNMLRNTLKTYPIIGDSDSGFAVSFLFDEVFNKAEINSDCVANSHIVGIGKANCPLSLVFCNGPLGMAPTYGHGHSHALSIQLYHNGHPVLSDPGTYSYTGQPEWREYFRSTKAHNTININDKDQAQQELLFMWSKPYNCKTLYFEQHKDSYIYIAQHDGYLNQDVLHKRMFIFSPNEGLHVKDFLLSSVKYKAELCWNICSLVNDGKITTSDNSILDCKLKKSTSDLTFKDNFQINDGWHSPQYNQKYPIKRIVSSINAQGNSSFTSTFTLEGEGIVDTWYEESEAIGLKFLEYN